jgi:hypothetical protein
VNATLLAAGGPPAGALDDNAVDKLRRSFRGALVRPADEGYEQARRIWNGAIDRRPALIARCTGVDDVVEALRLARERELVVSVRGGGHAVAGHAVCDGGVMIDLSLMKAISVDPAARTARAAGGVLWSELNRATQSFGLATTGGVISHTGIAGLTLGGGLGHLMRKHGLTVDNLASVDLVTADAERIHVDAQTSPSSSGDCGAAAATSASPPRSSTGWHRSGRSSWEARSSGRWPTPGRCWSCCTTTRRRHRTSSGSPSRCAWRRRSRSCRPNSTASPCWRSC